MLRLLFASIAIGCVWGQKVSTGLSISFTTATACSTESGSGGVQLSLLTSTIYTTTYATTIEAAVTVPSTTRVTASPVTTTGPLIQLSVAYTVVTTTLPTHTLWQNSQITFATATWPTTVCTNGVQPLILTEYTGTYTPIPGQGTTLPAVYPTLVRCTTAVTWSSHLYPTTTSGIVTETVTPTSTVYDTTSTSTTFFTYTTTTYSTTVSPTTTTFHVDRTATTISTACEPTATTTLAAKCAPTNMISSIDGVGLVSGTYADNATVVYIPDETYEDPSLCCQLCEDNEGCTAVMSGGSGYCGLYFVDGPDGRAVCDYTFTYGSQANVFPAQGLWVQMGCGTIEFEALISSVPGRHNVHRASMVVIHIPHFDKRGCRLPPAIRHQSTTLTSCGSNVLKSNRKAQCVDEIQFRG
ncbi:hypothetical protein F4778DRAFT_756503 [Xylariomycetidae sp. FL2044]|nr:hypothetical protein F4778DRAFT_756503 [Xylariomycetidae sp. FL2044]